MAIHALILQGSTSASETRGDVPSTRSSSPVEPRTRSPAGASDHPLGGLGFANWAIEVATQETELDTYFDTIIVCTVTGSTHAGMIAGFALENRDDRRVIGIDASATLQQTIDQVTRIAASTAEKIGVGRPLREDEITVLPGYEGPAYGVPDAATVEAIHLVARTEGVLTDPVYEGKSMAGLIGMIRSGEIAAGSPRALRPPRRPASAPGVCGLPGSWIARAGPLALIGGNSEHCASVPTETRKR